MTTAEGQCNTNLELELEHEIRQQALLAVLEDSNLLQGVQVHVHGDLGLKYY